VLATIATESNLYSIDTTGRTPTTFTLVATAVGPQLRDADCTTLSNLYSIDTTGRTPTTFTLVATAVGPQLRDADCTTLSLTNTGVKTATGVDPTVCW
jgi:Tfp pilus assembly protein PilE